ncbi:hypothetical protein [Rudaeicoccus suwonensis]|uniref:Uncharacterized protein n=1 Tax=Rudaeicoccus suwonensis TaxID=657409 RepID=A0A561E3C0_9MICO|nr:hypothetical protein [Rudaeicoccus suwonensis]TWE10091.1 hypothetical protein BKA23_2442 [Rudaeicoccus suwonensis]
MAACLALLLDQACSVGADGGQALLNLVSGEALLGQVDQALFTPVELYKFGVELPLNRRQAGLFLPDDIIDLFTEGINESVRQVKRFVVPGNVVLGERHRQVGQITDAAQAICAHEVSVGSGPRLRFGIDQLPCTSRSSAPAAVDLLLEIVKVSAVATCWR